MNLRPFAKFSLGIVSVSLLGGCYSQSSVYRAVSDVAVMRPNDAGSAGPLVLVASKPGAVKASAQTPELGSAFDRMTVTQIGIFDPHMGEYLRAQHDAAAKLAEVRSSPSPVAADVKQAEEKAAQTQKQVEDYAREWRDMQRKMAAANSPNGGKDAPATAVQLRKEGVAPSAADLSQTVLVVSEKKSWGFYSSNFTHTAVLIIDGQPKPGQYWLTADNSVLITASAWSAPARNRVGLVGSIKINSVKGNKIVADVAVRETTDSDSSELIAHLYDQAYYQTPWVLTGKHTFEITKPTDPAFEKAAVHWVME